MVLCSLSLAARATQVQSLTAKRAALGTMGHCEAVGKEGDVSGPSRVAGVAHPSDVCYHCKRLGHWAINCPQCHLTFAEIMALKKEQHDEAQQNSEMMQFLADAAADADAAGGTGDVEDGRGSLMDRVEATIVLPGSVAPMEVFKSKSKKK